MRHDKLEELFKQHEKAESPGELDDAERGLFPRPFYKLIVREAEKPYASMIYLQGVLCASEYALKKFPYVKDRSRHWIEREPLFWRGLLDHAGTIRLPFSGGRGTHVRTPLIRLNACYSVVMAFHEFCLDVVDDFDPEGMIEKQLPGGYLEVRGTRAVALAEVVWNWLESRITHPDRFDNVSAILAWTSDEARREAELEAASMRPPSVFDNLTGPRDFDERQEKK